MPIRRKAADAKGKNMIGLNVPFWTDHIAEGPKHAWSAGWVRLEPNPKHGIRGGRTFMFRTLFQLGSAIEKALIEGGVRLHPSRRTRLHPSRKTKR